MSDECPAAQLLRRADCILAVVDMQAKLVPEIAGAAEVVRSCRRIVRAADLLGVPVVFTEQYPRGLGPTVPQLVELFRDRRPIEKTAFGCFDCSAFAEHLGQTGRTALLLCGIEAPIRVFQTAAQALQRGFRVY